MRKPRQIRQKVPKILNQTWGKVTPLETAGFSEIYLGAKAMAL